MKDKVLFEIKEEHLETGLRGFPVGYCPTSFVDPQKGLFYRGMPIKEMEGFTPEKVIALLLTTLFQSKDEIEAFMQEVESHFACHPDVMKHISCLPRKGHPMKLMSAAVLILGMIEGKGNYLEDLKILIGKLPHLTALVINHHAGWGKTPMPKPSFGYMESFADMVNIPNTDKKKLHEVLDLFEILHMDHGGGNLSTFVGKAVASSLEDLYGSISSALSALAGPLHGKANQDGLGFVKRVLEAVGQKGTLEDVRTFIEGCVEEKKIIYGFGHAVLRVEDPRATIMYDYSTKYFGDHSLVKTALLIRKAGSEVMSRYPKFQDPFPNIDAISGTMLTAAGFGYPEYYTLLFGLSRSVGIGIQICYERLRARHGKGTPIVRPKYFYRDEF